VLEELREVNELVTAEATAEEVEAFRRWLLAAAQAAADAGKEGGFLGFGGEQVSAGEQRSWSRYAQRSGWPEPPSPRLGPGVRCTWTNPAHRAAPPVPKRAADSVADLVPALGSSY
jgi:hypothetical protein